jgi:hypothetical protein
LDCFALRRTELNKEEAVALLSAGDGIEDPVFLPPSVLDSLTVDDFEPDTFVEIGNLKDGVMLQALSFIQLTWCSKQPHDRSWGTGPRQKASFRLGRPSHARTD